MNDFLKIITKINVSFAVKFWKQSKISLGVQCFQNFWNVRVREFHNYSHALTEWLRSMLPLCALTNVLSVFISKLTSILRHGYKFQTFWFSFKMQWIWCSTHDSWSSLICLNFFSTFVRKTLLLINFCCRVRSLISNQRYQPFLKNSPSISYCFELGMFILFSKQNFHFLDSLSSWEFFRENLHLIH